jgi:UDP-N-acetylmuramate--alanine ligase
VLNLDNAESAALAAALPKSAVIGYSLENPKANLLGTTIEPERQGISFAVHERDSWANVPVKLSVPGRHNVANALAALGAARACGVSLKGAAVALESFAGIRRRLELVGTARGVTVIDDFAHNPDKIAATLATLHDFPGRLLLMFQPQGFGPLKLMKQELIDCFAESMGAEDILVMPQPVYFGGTVERSVTSDDIVVGVRARGREAHVFAQRAACGEMLLALARPGDRIVIMGARDDTLTQFASELLASLARKA